MAVVDLSGAFLSTDNPYLVHMMLRGKMSDLVDMIEPQVCRKFVILKIRGKFIMYMEMAKSVYGILHSAIFFI